MLLNFGVLNSVVCVITSVWIPGSPSSYFDTSTYEIKTVDLQYESVFISTVFWIIFETVMFFVMTVRIHLSSFLGIFSFFALIYAIKNSFQCLQCRTDKVLQLNRPRPYMMSPLPVLDENFRFDVPVRKYYFKLVFC